MPNQENAINEKDTKKNNTKATEKQQKNNRKETKPQQQSNQKATAKNK